DIRKSAGEYQLVIPKDTKKDQTYFLSSIPKQSLRKVLFPLADLTKDQVRQIALRENLPVSSKPESQDICFIPKGNTEEYLREHLSPPPGDIVDQKGNIIGAHRGIAFYTIGQRARLSMNWGRPLYVIAKDIAGNRITIGERENLLARGLMANSMNLFTESLPEKAYAKIRYAHAPALCRVTIENDCMMILFDEPQEAITPGQTVALYADGAVLASGIISEMIG
ncbi:MAG TPA: tRNA 2-thiouridine(34) synthase MnmA, partial [Deltaproteobacteria bacterium]|nr:tRNA 2-thiouridine(34) synthase MnmA [Deltaproteobacteria bacterium]